MSRKETGVLPGSTAMLVLAVLKDQELYGYRIIEELAARSQNVFQLKEGTLYPLLHTLEAQGLVRSFDGRAAGRVRRYYHITEAGRAALAEQAEAWATYAGAVKGILEGGVLCGT